MASPTSRHLARLWRSVPLAGLQQGSSLSIRSNLPGPTHIFLKSEWRDSGHVELKQVFSKNSSSVMAEANMKIMQEGDTMTSLGRLASHVSLMLEPESPLDGTTHDATRAQDQQTIPQSTSKPKPPDKVILDDGTIKPDGAEFSPPPEGTRRVEYHDGIAHVTSDENPEEEPGTFLSLQMPEKVNLICELNNGGSITIVGKVEGDIRLYTADGDMSVTKLRGHNVEMESRGPNNLIFVKELLEAKDVTVKTQGRLRAKQIHGTTVDVQINPDDETAKQAIHSLDEDDEGSLVDIGSMYIGSNGGATIKVGPCQPSRRAVRVKSSHGPLRVETDGVGMPTETNHATDQTYPVVELGGVNGNCEVSIGNAGLLESVKEMEWSSCMVHVDSLSPDSVSLVTAQQGDVSVTLDRKVEADLRLLSISSLSKESMLEKLGTTLAEEEDPDAVGDALRNYQGATAPNALDEQISIKTTAFSRGPTDLTVEGLEYVDGWVDNKSEEPDSRFDRKVSGSVGKIRIASAADQALDGFSEKGDTDVYLRPLFAVAGTKKILVETVSWLGAIARRYGLEESGRELGRTASRRGRPIDPKNE